MSDPHTQLPDEFYEYYNSGSEAGRLLKGIGPLEYTRTCELIKRYFPPPLADVFDIGGGPGAYSLWLAREGFTVHLVDAVPLHIEQARAASRKQPEHPIASLEVGDARRLEHPDACAEAVLLHGPLYHLTERDDRLRALREARRVLRPGGMLLAVGISRYASTHVGLTRWWLEDQDYLEMCEHELATGQHRAPSSWPGLFTTAYFHHPDELGEEIEAAGLEHQETLAVQGPGWLVPDIEGIWEDPKKRELLLKVVRLMEREPVALGISAHILGVARKEFT